MTKKQREQVVELLRCAADNLSPDSIGAWTGALDGLDIGMAVEMLATRAFNAVLDEKLPLLTAQKWNCEFGRHCYLEAAQRVEEGWTP